MLRVPCVLLLSLLWVGEHAEGLSKHHITRSSRFSSALSASSWPSSTSPTESSPIPAKIDSLVLDFESDLNKLSELRPSEISSDISAPKTLISAGSSYTRLWTSSTWQRHSKPPHLRYATHVFRWRHSTTARKILPSVLISATWAGLASFCCKYFDWSRVLLQSSAGSVAAATSVLSAPLALLLTLRANSSLGRLLEARLLWGRMVLHTRTLSSLLQVYIFPFAPRLTIQAARLLSVLSWQLKAYLRGESVESQRQVLSIMLDRSTVDWLLDDTQTPYQKSIVTIPSRIRQACNSALKHVQDQQSSSSTMLSLSSTAPQFQIEAEIANLEQVCGGCERLHSSPIPPTYSRHLSRVISMFLTMFPISLLSAGVSPIGTIVASTIASYVFIGIDEVGMEIENAFQLLPLQQLAAASQNAVRDQFTYMQRGPPLVTEEE